MNNPLIPLILMLLLVGTAWLGIFEPLLSSGNVRAFFDEVQRWQTLIAALIAILAAYVAWTNTTRQLRHAADLERTRRSRKQIALRAILSLNLSSLADYANQSTKALARLFDQCVQEAVPKTGVIVPTFPEIPEPLVSALAEFIEFSDDLDVTLFENLLARLQIHDSRVRSLRSEINSSGHITTMTWLETLIVDAASIHAGAALAFNYARRRTQEIPTAISWKNVREALFTMRMWDHEYPRIYESIERRERKSAGPWTD